MCFMIILGQKIIYFWTTYKINPNFSLIIITAIAVLLTCYSNMYSTILFGINAIDFQMYLAILQAILNIVLSYIFIKYCNLGINGVILATCFCMATNIFTLPKVLNKKLETIKEI